MSHLNNLIIQQNTNLCIRIMNDNLSKLEKEKASELDEKVTLGEVIDLIKNMFCRTPDKMETYKEIMEVSEKQNLEPVTWDNHSNEDFVKNYIDILKKL